MFNRLSAGQKKSIQIAVSVIVIGIFASQLSWSTITRFFSRADGWVLFAMIVLFPIDRFFMAWKWHLLVRNHKTGVRLWDAIRIYLASSAVGLVLPLGGLGPDVARVAMLSAHGMPSDVSVPSILVERICGIASAVMMMGLSIVLMALLVQEQSSDQLLLFFALIAGVGAAVLLLLYGFGRSELFAKFLTKLKVRYSLEKYFAAVDWYGKRKGLLSLSIGLAWIEQWAPIVAFYLACRGFDVPLSLLQCAAIVPLASILERLPISFAGLGVREAGLVLGAAWFGIPRADAFLAGLTEHALYMLTIIPLALLYFAREKKHEQAIAEQR